MPKVEPSDVFKAAVDLIKAQSEWSARWASHFFTVQAPLVGSLGATLGLARSGSIQNLPVSLESVLSGLGLFGILFSIILPRLYERNQLWQGRFVLATRRAEDAAGDGAIHFYDDDAINQINAGRGSWTGRAIIRLG